MIGLFYPIALKYTSDNIKELLISKGDINAKDISDLNMIILFLIKII